MSESNGSNVIQFPQAQATGASVPASPRVYDGDEANARVRDLAERRRGAAQHGDSVKLGMSFFDANNPALTRGDIALIIGNTSEGKSKLATTIEMNVLDTLKREGRAEGAGIVNVLTEETIEARRIQMWDDRRVSLFQVLNGATPLEVIDANIAKTKGEPVYFIGHSAGPVDVSTDDTFGALTVKRIAVALSKLIDAGVKLELVIIDHAHDLATEDDTANEMELYSQVARQLVRLAGWMSGHCPLLITAQANKDVMKRGALDRKPTKYDLSYMAALARRARDIYSVWYPHLHLGGKNVRIPITGRDVAPAVGTFIVTGEKLRYAQAARSCAMTAMDDSGQWSTRLREVGNSNGR